MVQPPDADEASPPAAPESTEPASFHVERVPLARWTDFANLAFQFRLIGTAGLLVGLLVLAEDGGSWLALGFLLGGAVFLATGFGLAAYKPWAWYSAAVLPLPMLVLAVLPTLLFPLDYGRGTRLTSAVVNVVVLVVVSAYCAYVGWILFSRAGRQRYKASPRPTAAVRWANIADLTVQFKLLGSAGLWFGFSGLSADGAWWLALGFLLGGAVFLATGFGLAAYKPWARFAAAVLIVLMPAIAVLPALPFALNSAQGTRATSMLAIGAVLVIVSAYSAYVGWILFSHAGRWRYAASSRAMAAAHDTPSSIASRLHRGK